MLMWLSAVSSVVGQIKRHHLSLNFLTKPSCKWTQSAVSSISDPPLHFIYHPHNNPHLPLGDHEPPPPPPPPPPLAPPPPPRGFFHKRNSTGGGGEGAAGREGRAPTAAVGFITRDVPAGGVQCTTRRSCRTERPTYYYRNDQSLSWNKNHNIIT